MIEFRQCRKMLMRLACCLIVGVAVVLVTTPSTSVAQNQSSQFASPAAAVKVQPRTSGHLGEQQTERNLQSIQKAAPERCVAYFSWAGWDDFDPQRSSTEKWLHQPEIQKAIETIRHELTGLLPDQNEAADQKSLETLLFQLSHHLAASPTGLSINQLDFENGDKQLRLSLGVISDLGDRVDEVTRAVDDYFQNPSAPTRKTIDILQRQFQLVHLPGPLPELYFGTIGQRIVLATDLQVVRQILKDMETDSPVWLKELCERYPIEHQTGLTRIDLQSIQSTVINRFAPDRRELWLALGLDQATEWGAITGLESRGTVQRGGLKLSGTPRGLFQLLEPETTIDREQMFGIDPKSDQIHLLQLPVRRLLPFVKETAKQLGAADPIEEPAWQLEQDLGIDLEALLGSLSGQFTCYGKLSMPFPARGWVVCIGVADEAAFEEQFTKIADYLRQRSGVELTEEQRDGKLYYQISAGQAVYLSRSAGEVVVSMNRRSISKYWKRKQSVSSTKSEEGKQEEATQAGDQLIQELDSMSELFLDSELKDRKFVYAGSIDFRPYIQLAVPILSVVLQGSVPGTNLSMQDAPSAQVLTKYWEPSLFALYRSETGYDFYSRQTFPFLSPGPMAPTVVGWLIPIIQAIEESERR